MGSNGGAKRRFRVSLRAALIILLVLQVPLIYVARLRARAAEEREAVNSLIGPSNGRVWRDQFIIDGEGMLHPNERSWYADLMRRCGIEEYFYPATRIEIRGRDFDERLEQTLAKLPSLKSITFLACAFSSDAAFPANCKPHVESVGIRGSDIPATLFESLAAQPRLSALLLEDCSLAQPGIAGLGQLTNLRQLELSHLKKEVRDWSFLGRLPHLAGLEISHLPNSRLNLAALPPTVRYLRVRGTDISTEPDFSLPTPLGLDSIVLRESNLTEKQVIYLVQHSPKLTWACFTETTLSDDEKRAIKERFPQIRFQL